VRFEEADRVTPTLPPGAYGYSALPRGMKISISLRRRGFVRREGIGDRTPRRTVPSTPSKRNFGPGSDARADFEAPRLPTQACPQMGGWRSLTAPPWSAQTAHRASGRIRPSDALPGSRSCGYSARRYSVAFTRSYPSLLEVAGLADPTSVGGTRFTVARPLIHASRPPSLAAFSRVSATCPLLRDPSDNRAAAI